MRSKRWFYAVCVAGSLAVVSSIVAEDKEVKIKKVPATYMAPIEGATMYQAYCAACHGASGKGDGPVASALKSPATDLTKMTLNNQGVFPSLAVLITLRQGTGAHGTPDMPVWGNIFRQSWGDTDLNVRTYSLTRYLESIQEPAPPPPAKEPKQRQLRITDIRPHFGGDMYRAYCGSCHGVDGRGNGPAAYTLKKTPTDLTALRGADGKFPGAKIHKLLEQPAAGVHGSTEMPVWGDLFRATHEDETVIKLRISNLSRYLESIQR